MGWWGEGAIPWAAMTCSPFPLDFLSGPCLISTLGFQKWILVHALLFVPFSGLLLYLCLSFLRWAGRSGRVLAHKLPLSSPTLQGAPESVIERCSSVRVGNRTVPLNTTAREQILAKVRDWGSGSDTLRCLALATRDAPPRKEDMQLDDCSKFMQYEVGAGAPGQEPCVCLQRPGRWRLRMGPGPTCICLLPTDGPDFRGLCGHAGPSEA